MTENPSRKFADKQEIGSRCGNQPISRRLIGGNEEHEIDPSFLPLRLPSVEWIRSIPKGIEDSQTRITVVLYQTDW
jgi:hypothetical protein